MSEPGDRRPLRRLSALSPALVAAIGMTAVAGSVARGDEVLFNNGDRLSGKVLSVEGGKLKVKTTVAGEVVVELSDVKTFTTDEPIEVRTTADEVITAPAARAGQSGAISLPVTPASPAATAPTTAPADALPPGVTVPATRDVRFDDIRYVNLDQGWTGAVIAGALFARGNTYADQANVSFDAVRRRLDDRLTFNGQYSFGRQEDPDTGDKLTTVDNGYAAGKYDYFLSEKLYLFATFRYERDRIAELDRRVIPGAGVGYLWFDGADFKFDTEAGVAYVAEKYEDGGTSEATSIRLAYHLKRDLWDDKVNLFHNLEYFPSLERVDDFLVIADAGVRAAMTERMFAEYKIEYRYDPSPAQGLHKDDLRHVLGVGWKF